MISTETVLGVEGVGAPGTAPAAQKGAPPGEERAEYSGKERAMAAALAYTSRLRHTNCKFV